MFNKQIYMVQNETITINYMGAILCYIVMITGLYYFIIKDKKPVKDAIILGLIVFSTYELTNLALLKEWNYITVIADTVWGGILFGMTTWCVYRVLKINLNLKINNNKHNMIDIMDVHPASIIL